MEEETERSSRNPNATTHTLLLLAIVASILGLPWLLRSSSHSFLLLSGDDGDDDEDDDAEPGGSSLAFLLLRLSPQLLVMILPLFLILAVRFLATETAASWMGFRADASTIHRIGGSSAGVAALVLLVLAMVLLQSFLLP